MAQEQADLRVRTDIYEYQAAFLSGAVESSLRLPGAAEEIDEFELAKKQKGVDSDPSDNQCSACCGSKPHPCPPPPPKPKPKKHASWQDLP